MPSLSAPISTASPASRPLRISTFVPSDAPTSTATRSVPPSAAGTVTKNLAIELPHGRGRDEHGLLADLREDRDAGAHARGRQRPRGERAACLAARVGAGALALPAAARETRAELLGQLEAVGERHPFGERLVVRERLQHLLDRDALGQLDAAEELASVSASEAAFASSSAAARTTRTSAAEAVAEGETPSLAAERRQLCCHLAISSPLRITASTG